MKSILRINGYHKTGGADFFNAMCLIECMQCVKMVTV